MDDRADLSTRTRRLTTRGRERAVHLPIDGMGPTHACQSLSTGRPAPAPVRR